MSKSAAMSKTAEKKSAGRKTAAVRASARRTVERPRKRRPAKSKPAADLRSRYSDGDVANADRLVELHGDSMRYCHAWKRWLVWDGRRWAADHTGAALRLAKRTADTILAESQNGDETRPAARAARVASQRRLEAMLALAAPELAVVPEELDRDGWLLNCANGTLDLRTGLLREHRRDDYLTRLCPTSYLPDAPTGDWVGFLESIFLKPSLVDFVRKYLGYCLTGNVREQFLLICWGEGSNGKSTLLEAFLQTLGPDYAMKAPADLLIVKKNDAHPTERADLFGKRFVACVESGPARRLNESFVKELTGGDTIRARRLYENHWQFPPTHKVLLCTNSCPEVNGTDHAIWRRLGLLQFPVTFWDADKGESGPDELRQDKDLPERLRRAAEGILAWCVQGCLDWKQNRLQLAPEIIAATQRYRRSEDIVAAFIEDCCVIDAGCRVRAGSLYSAYEFWCIREGRRDIGSRLFGEAVNARFEKVTNNGVWYRGLDLRKGWEF